MKRLFTTLVALALIVPIVALAPAAAQTTGGEVFVATLSGDAQVPTAVDTDGQGIAAFSVSDDGSSMDYVLITYGLEAVTQAHIHIGAANVNGAVAVTLLDFNAEGITFDGQLATGTITGADVTGMTLAELIAAMSAGNTYVNVHNAAYAAGVVRGQIAELNVTDAFTDDDGNFHEDNINLIAAAGITTGTSGTNYTPLGTVFRRQMSAFITRAFNLPMTTTDYFTDDNGTIFEPYNNAMAAAGVSLGCAPNLFCPNNEVTRGQMASFIMRAIGLDVASGGDFFGDDDGSVHEENINSLAGIGVTTGVTADDYGPGDPVRRDQMATFLARAHRFADRSPQVFALTILHNNDGESELVADNGVGGAARFKAVVDQQKAIGNAQTDGVLMLSSGDNFLAGTAWQASVDDGIYYDVLTLEAIGYDAVQIGNHDFDFGPDVLADFIGAYTDPPPYLSSNLDFSGEPALQALVTAGTIAPSTSVDVGGMTVGIVGATTPNLDFISSPRNVVVDDDVTGSIQTEFDALAASGADILILISHLQGVDEDIALGPDLSGLDVMIAGGGDELLANDASELLPDDDIADAYGPYPLTTTNDEGTEVPVVTTSGQYGYLGRLVVFFDLDGNVVDTAGGPIPINGQAQDATLLADVETPVAAYQAGLAADVIGTSEVELDGVRENVRSMETNEGNLIADALLWQGGELAGGFGVNAPDVALQNGGGIRNDDTRGPGDITTLDTFDMLPFGNFLSIVEDIPRSQFLEILENAVSALESDGSLGGEGTGRFAQIAGFRFEWEGSGTAQVLDDDGNVTTVGTRVQDVWLLNPDGSDGEQIVIAGAVQAGADLNIAISSFLAAGGDQYPFRDAPYTTLGVTDQQSLANYIQAAAADGGLEGTIAAADYPEGGEGRITFTP